jgi:hypothetical protein
MDVEEEEFARRRENLALFEVCTAGPVEQSCENAAKPAATQPVRIGTSVARLKVVRTDRSSHGVARPVSARASIGVPSARPRDRRDPASRQDLIRRVTVEYDEMPALRLTLAQARRLFALPEDVCARVLDTLVATGELEQDAEGAFVRSPSRS